MLLLYQRYGTQVDRSPEPQLQSVSSEQREHEEEPEDHGSTSFNIIIPVDFVLLIKTVFVASGIVAVSFSPSLPMYCDQFGGRRRGGRRRKVVSPSDEVTGQ